MKTIEQLALEVVHKLDEDQPSLSMQGSDAWHIGFAKAFLAAVDAERGEPVAWKSGVNVTLNKQVGEIIWPSVGSFVEPLYLAPHPTPADVEDARRYRWLRNSAVGPSQIWELLADDCNPPIMTLKSMHELDAAIDAAMGEES